MPDRTAGRLAVRGWFNRNGRRTKIPLVSHFVRWFRTAGMKPSSGMRNQGAKPRESAKIEPLEPTFHGGLVEQSGPSGTVPMHH